MKKKCVQFLFLIVLAVSAHAGINDGILTITNLSRQDVLIEVDGRAFPECNNALILRDLRPGYHTVKVYIEKGRMPSLRRIAIYNKNVYVKSRFNVDIVINRFGRALMDEQPIAGNGYDNDGWNGNDSNDPNNCDEGNDKNNNDKPNTWPPRNGNVTPRPIADNTFASLLESIKKESFDDARMAVAMAGIDQHFFTSAQARQVIGLLSFEDSKLVIAKYLYAKTTDPKNYFVVYSVFAFSRTKDELAEYVKNYK